MSVIFTVALMAQAKWSTRHSITHLQSPKADTAESSKFSMVENMPRLPLRAAPSGRPERANLGLCRTRARVCYRVCVHDYVRVCAYVFVLSIRLSVNSSIYSSVRWSLALPYVSASASVPNLPQFYACRVYRIPSPSRNFGRVGQLCKR